MRDAGDIKAVLTRLAMFRTLCVGDEALTRLEGGADELRGLVFGSDALAGGEAVDASNASEVMSKPMVRRNPALLSCFSGCVFDCLESAGYFFVYVANSFAN